MKIYIKTPRQNNNKYLPHLLEHCVFQSKDLHNFLQEEFTIYASTASWYTEFEFEKENLNLLKQKLTTPISQESFNLQSKIIKEELKEASFWQKLYLDVYRKISWNKELISNKVQNGITLKEIQTYQNKYYKLEKMIVVDDKNELIKIRWTAETVKIDPIINIKSEIKHKQTKFQWQIYDNIYNKYETPYDILLLDFFYDLVNDYTYYKTTKKWKYRYDSSDISLTDEYMILNFEQQYLPKDIEKEFFETYKGYYQKEIKKFKKREYIPIITLFTTQYISNLQHLKYIESIEYKTINDICQLVKK